MDGVALHVQAAFEDWMDVQRWMRREQLRAEERHDEEPEPRPAQRIQNLLFNVVPGSAKSRILAVYTPAWAWLHWPEWRALFLSANPDVAQRDSVYCREVIESDWYQSWFLPDWQLADDQNAKNFYRNTRGGLRRAKGFLAKITGDRYDALFVDDPNDPEEAHSETIRTSVNTRWRSTIYNRVNDLRTSLRIGIQQRVHEDDWSNTFLQDGNCEHVCIPMEFEPQRLDAEADRIPRVTSIGWSDPRKEEGELLFPERFPQDVVAFEKKRLGSYGYAGQHQQRPAPAGGGMLKRHWWRFWIPAGATQPNGQPIPTVRVKMEDGSFWECPQVELPSDLEEVAQSWDMAFKDTAASAYVVGQVWARKLADRFLLDEDRKKRDFPSTLKAVIDLSEKWPQARLKLVEDKANGPAIMQTLHSNVSGLVPVEPDGTKEARCAAVSPEIESGNVYLPHPSLFPWVEGFMGECGVFPNGTYKDRVDTMTQMLIRWGGPQPAIAVSGTSAGAESSTSRLQAILERAKRGGGQ